MRNSSALFCKTLLIGISFTALNSYSAESTPQTDPSSSYDNYYGQTDAQSSQSYADIAVNPNAPRTYTVQKGDTLWGIANKFLNTPWYWPEVWDKNQGIANPHQIYPGDVLVLDYVKVTSPVSNGDKWIPRIRVDQRGQGEPISTLIPFMTWPRVLDEATIKSAPYVIAGRDDQELITQGDLFYVQNLQNAAVGTRCAIFHSNKALHDPRTGALLGYEVTYGGNSRIEALGNPAKATVLQAKREIRPGDRLLLPVDETATLNAPIHPPTFPIDADIVALFDAEAVSGNYMIATINQGSNQGIEVGHTLGIYTAGRVVNDPVMKMRGQLGSELPQERQLPTEKVANLVIYKVTANVSYGLILDASREIKNHDKIANP